MWEDTSYTISAPHGNTRTSHGPFIDAWYGRTRRCCLSLRTGSESATGYGGKIAALGLHMAMGLEGYLAANLRQVVYNDLSKSISPEVQIICLPRNYLILYYQIFIYVTRLPRWCSGCPRVLLVLVLEFESRSGESWFILQNKMDQLLRARIAWVGTIRRDSTREERTAIFSRLKSKARAVVGRGWEEPVMWPRIWVTTRREREK